MSSKAAVLLFGTILVVLFISDDIRAVECDLVWSTFLGDTWPEWGEAIAVDDSGCVYVTGMTQSANFPATPGAYDTLYDDNGDIFIAKLNVQGSALVYSTFLGGSESDIPYDLALDVTGNVYVTGRVTSQYVDFPTTPGAFDTIYNGGSTDAFVTKLHSSGGSLMFSTYLGGGESDFGYGIAVDDSSNVYVTGQTSSGDFPTTSGALDTVIGGSQDGFVVKFNEVGSALCYSTYLGGASIEEAQGIDVDLDGRVHIVGSTWSSDFPTTEGAYDTTYNSNCDVFIIKLNPEGTDLDYSSFLGGAGRDSGQVIVVDASGYTYLTGRTSASDDFPTTSGAFDQTYNGNKDVFITKLNPGGNTLVYSTYLGGTHSDVVKGLAVDGAGEVYLTGETYSDDFPTTPGSYQTTNRGEYDAFLAKLDSTGGELLYCTYLGGLADDFGYGIVTDDSAYAYLTGLTRSENFPISPAAYDTVYDGSRDVFVTKMNTSLRPPEAIDNLSAHLDGGRNEKSFLGNIRLFWSEPYDETGVDYYVIYRSTDPTSFSDTLAIVSDTTYLDPDIAGDEYNQYFYMIQAVDGAGRKSPDSNTVGEFDTFLGSPY